MCDYLIVVLICVLLKYCAYWPFVSIWDLSFSL